MEIPCKNPVVLRGARGGAAQETTMRGGAPMDRARASPVAAQVVRVGGSTQSPTNLLSPPLQNPTTLRLPPSTLHGAGFFVMFWVFVVNLAMCHVAFGGVTWRVGCSMGARSCSRGEGRASRNFLGCSRAEGERPRSFLGCSRGAGGVPCGVGGRPVFQTRRHVVGSGRPWRERVVPWFDRVVTFLVVMFLA
jgi:hypothetical protein